MKIKFHWENYMFDISYVPVRQWNFKLADFYRIILTNPLELQKGPGDEAAAQREL